MTTTSNEKQILSDLTVYLKYAKYLPNKRRRETWSEICNRYEDMMIKKYPIVISEIVENMKMVRAKKILPSMRALQFAGKPIETNNARLFNCCYMPIDDIKAFSETLFLLLAGVGVGFSVRRQHIESLPSVKFPTGQRRYLVGDSIEGWADAIKMLMKAYFGESNLEPVFDYSDIRPKGAQLVTAGGKAPGPEPLKKCIELVKVILLKKKEGTKMTSLECHDILSHLANAVLAGGIRRCIPLDSKVYSNKGLINIDELEIGHSVIGKSGKFQLVTAKEYTGKKQVAMINTAIGPLTSSHEHRWAVVSNIRGDVEYKEAKDLTSDDRLYFSTLGVDGIETSWPEWEYVYPEKSTTCTKITIPSLDKGSAWLLGQIHGDGCVYLTKRIGSDRNKWSNGYVSVACADEGAGGQKDRVVEELLRWGVNPKINDRANEKCSIVMATSQQLSQYMSAFKTSKKTIDVPEFINRGTREIRAAYIAGLFDADGSCSSGTEKRVVIAHSVYPDYLRQVASVARSLGIPCKVSMTRPEKGNWQAVYTLYVVSTKGQQMWDQNILLHSLKWPLHRDYILSRTRDVGYNFSGINILNSNKEDIKILMTSNRRANQNIGVVEVEKILNITFDFIPLPIISVDLITETEEMVDISVQNEECFLADGVLTHNSAMISLFDADDNDMLECKSGSWWEDNEQRGRANNSAVLYRDEVTKEDFLHIWKKIQDSGCGEPGKFLSNDRDSGTNPCVEIRLRPNSFCNLAEINATTIISQEDFDLRSKTAAFFATLQAGFTDFHYLRPIWKETTDEDALIGVSITGIASGTLTNLNLKQAAAAVKIENQRVAHVIGINAAARNTAVKPAGSTSLVCSSSSGIHAWHDKFYLRSIRVGKNEPIYDYFKEKLPNLVEDDIFNASQGIVRIPQKAPEGATTRDESVFEFLERVKRFNVEWVQEGFDRGPDHNNVSATVSIKPDEWEAVGEWMWKNKQSYSGLSVLPYDTGSYVQAPFETITEDKYNELIKELVGMDLSEITEDTDETDLRAEAACVGNECEVK